MGILLIIYLIGCILSFGLYTNFMQGLDMNYIDSLKPEKWWNEDMEFKFISLFTIFLSFIGCVVIFIISNEEGIKIGLKYSYKKILGIYYTKTNKYEELSNNHTEQDF